MSKVIPFDYNSYCFHLLEALDRVDLKKCRYRGRVPSDNIRVFSLGQETIHYLAANGFSDVLYEVIKCWEWYYADELEILPTTYFVQDIYEGCL